ncbi:hypothetical protein CSUB01_12072 [Colletotrichum sublineola]|uniref:Uncharacterized protein n=1 Tax=Colletotrichum sublineola TaxID=1173701 RepID=A0A066XIK6_COLSU|nr:hypothetical protein CSUB01_12072 [Colletotrichum sublineola]
MFQRSPQSTYLPGYSPYQTQQAQGQPTTVVQADSSSDVQRTGHGGLGSVPTANDTQLALSDMQHLGLMPVTFNIDGPVTPYGNGPATEHSGYQANYGLPNAQDSQTMHIFADLHVILDQVQQLEKDQCKRRKQEMDYIKHLQDKQGKATDMMYSLSDLAE